MIENGTWNNYKIFLISTIEITRGMVYERNEQRVNKRVLTKFFVVQDYQKHGEVGGNVWTKHIKLMVTKYPISET